MLKTIEVIIAMSKYVINHLTKKIIIIFSIGFSLVMIGIVSWNVFFSKYYIFNQYEKLFLETVKDYYAYHSVYLPKENQIKTITLGELYEGNRIDTLMAPKSDKLCSTDSWVKVFNDNGKYKYFTYLKCNKMESKADHEGPVITLNGDDTIYVDLNHDYEELGVKEVKDNKDGIVDINKVIIDSSKVDTKKVGSYNVSYTVRDSLYNETRVIRKVVVTRNLTTTVKDSTDESGYYKGQIYNNYVLFSGMMFRIVNVNEDGTVKLVSDEILNNMDVTYSEYENSNIDSFLNNEYFPIIHDSSYIVESEYCVGNVENYNDVDGACSKKIKRKVSTLSIKDINNSIIDGKSYLCEVYQVSLSNYINDKNLISNYYGNKCLDEVDNSNNFLPGVKPVITLKSNLIIISGDGSISSPYKLKDYSYGKTGDEINTRLIGEYVIYSGIPYRIIKTDKDSVTLIAKDSLYVNSLEVNRKFLTFEIPQNKNYVFNLEDKDNPGYLANYKFIDYINDAYINKIEYEIPENKPGVKYNEYKTTKVSAKIAFPRTYDLFSGMNRSESSVFPLYLDKTDDNKIFYLSILSGSVYKKNTDFRNNFSFKPVINISGKLKIKSGKGTKSNPYYINKI